MDEKRGPPIANPLQGISNALEKKIKPKVIHLSAKKKSLDKNYFQLGAIHKGRPPQYLAYI